MTDTTCQMLYNIYISSEASLTYVHAMQIFPVRIGVSNLPTSFVSLLTILVEKDWGKKSP